MSIEHFIKERDKGFPSSVYLLKAKNDFFFREALKVIKEAIPDGERDFNLDSYDLEDSEQQVSVPEMIDNLNTLSFFSHHKFVVIRNLQKMKKGDFEKVSRYIKEPSPDSKLILFHSGDIKRERKAIFKDSKVIDLDLKVREIPKWIEKQAFIAGIKLSNDAIGFLCDIFGENISLLKNEIEKLSLSGKKHINMNDIQEIIYGTKSFSSFQMTEAIVKGDKEEAIKIHQAIKGNVDKFMLLGAMNWQISRGKNIEEKKLLKCYELLSDTEVRLKSTNPDFPLEWLILKLSQVLKQN